MAMNVVGIQSSDLNDILAENTPSISIVAPLILAIYDDLLVEQTSIKHQSGLCESLLSSFTSRFGGLLEQMLIEVKILDKNKNKRFYNLFKDPIFLIARLSASVISGEIQKELRNKIQQMGFDQCVVLEHANRSQIASTNDTSPISPRLSSQATNIITASSSSTPKRKSIFSNIQMQETSGLVEMQS